MRYARMLPGVGMLTTFLALAGGCSKAPMHADETARADGAADSQSSVTEPGTVHADDADQVAGTTKNKVAKRMKRATSRRLRQPATKPATAADEYVPEDVTELKMPPVQLTSAQLETCRLKVGDTMPDFELPDLDGEVTSLGKLRGPRLTVVAFWTSTHPFAVEELADLGPLIVDRFGDKGLQVVAIDEHDSPSTARRVADRVGADFSILVDAHGTAFDQCGSRLLPRTYLLDASGRVLWFDIEYSRSTRRDLVQAIRFVLNEQ